jgi:NAD(P)H-flavin reductase
LETLNHDCGTFFYVPTLSRPSPQERWFGHNGRVQSVFEDETVRIDPARHHIFLCGAPEMVEEMQKYFSLRGFPSGNLHLEKYW